MNLFPIATCNKNVPAGSFILCEYSQCSGEIITTIYATDTGRVYRVTDWISDKPHEVNICDAAREMGYAPITIMAKIVKWSCIAEALREAQEAAQ